MLMPSQPTRRLSLWIPGTLRPWLAWLESTGALERIRKLKNSSKGQLLKVKNMQWYVIKSSMYTSVWSKWSCQGREPFIISKSILANRRTRSVIFMTNVLCMWQKFYSWLFVMRTDIPTWGSEVALYTQQTQIFNVAHRKRDGLCVRSHLKNITKTRWN